MSRAQHRPRLKAGRLAALLLAGPASGQLAVPRGCPDISCSFSASEAAVVYLPSDRFKPTMDIVTAVNEGI
jgi:hypothetical protein